MPGVVQDGTTPDHPPLAGIIIEAARPLSQSALWQVQQGYFNEVGVRAWTSGELPFHLTTSALLARTYARLVAAFLEDCTAGRVDAFDPTEPVYVIALGEGTGRFGFEFLSLFDAARFSPLRVVYVFTDLADSNIQFISHHPKLQPFFDTGRADYARYEMGADGPLQLVRSGIDLFSAPPVNPTICVANYAFDVIPQDLYASVDSVLYQEHVELSAMTAAQELTSADFLASLFVATERVPVAAGDLEGGLLGSTLSAIATAPDQDDRRFLFPVAALRTLERFLQVFGERLLLLVADRCDALPDGTTDQGAMEALISAMPALPEGFVPMVTISGKKKYRPAILGMGVHGGSFSLPIYMGIIGRALAPFGFTVLTAEDAPNLIQVSVVANETRAELLQLRQAHGEVVGDLSTENLLFTLGAAGKAIDNGLTLREILSILRVSGYGPGFLREYRFALEQPLRDATPTLVDEAARVFDKVYEHYFPLLETDDLAWDIAILLAVAGRYESALAYHERSLAVSGQSPERCWRIAECHFLLGEHAQALSWIDQSLSLQPEYEPARALRAQLLGEAEQAT